MLALVAIIATAAIAASPNDPLKVKPLTVGTAAPAFTVREADGKPFRFEPGKLARPVMFIFYRGGWFPTATRT